MSILACVASNSVVSAGLLITIDQTQDMLTGFMYVRIWPRICPMTDCYQQPCFGHSRFTSIFMHSNPLQLFMCCIRTQNMYIKQYCVEVYYDSLEVETCKKQQHGYVLYVIQLTLLNLIITSSAGYKFLARMAANESEQEATVHLKTWNNGGKTEWTVYVALNYTLCYCWPLLHAYTMHSRAFSYSTSHT